MTLRSAANAWRKLVRASSSSASSHKQSREAVAAVRFAGAQREIGEQGASLAGGNTNLAAAGVADVEGAQHL